MGLCGSKASGSVADPAHVVVSDSERPRPVPRASLPTRPLSPSMDVMGRRKSFGREVELTLDLEKGDFGDSSDSRALAEPVADGGPPPPAVAALVLSVSGSNWLRSSPTMSSIVSSARDDATAATAAAAAACESKSSATRSPADANANASRSANATAASNGKAASPPAAAVETAEAKGTDPQSHPPSHSRSHSSGSSTAAHHRPAHSSSLLAPPYNSALQDHERPPFELFRSLYYLYRLLPREVERNTFVHALKDEWCQIDPELAGWVRVELPERLRMQQRRARAAASAAVAAVAGSKSKERIDSQIASENAYGAVSSAAERSELPADADDAEAAQILTFWDHANAKLRQLEVAPIPSLDPHSPASAGSDDVDAERKVAERPLSLSDSADSLFEYPLRHASARVSLPPAPLWFLKGCVGEFEVEAEAEIVRARVPEEVDANVFISSLCEQWRVLDRERFGVVTRARLRFFLWCSYASGWSRDRSESELEKELCGMDRRGDPLPDEVLTELEAIILATGGRDYFSFESFADMLIGEAVKQLALEAEAEAEAEAAASQFGGTRRTNSSASAAALDNPLIAHFDKMQLTPSPCDSPRNADHRPRRVVAEDVDGDEEEEDPSEQYLHSEWRSDHSNDRCESDVQDPSWDADNLLGTEASRDREKKMDAADNVEDAPASSSESSSLPSRTGGPAAPEQWDVHEHSAAPQHAEAPDAGKFYVQVEPPPQSAPSAVAVTAAAAAAAASRAQRDVRESRAPHSQSHSQSQSHSESEEAKAKAAPRGAFDASQGRVQTRTDVQLDAAEVCGPRPLSPILEDLRREHALSDTCAAAPRSQTESPPTLTDAEPCSSSERLGSTCGGDVGSDVDVDAPTSAEPGCALATSETGTRDASHDSPSAGSSSESPRPSSAPPDAAVAVGLQRPPPTSSDLSSTSAPEVQLLPSKDLAASIHTPELAPQAPSAAVTSLKSPSPTATGSIPSPAARSPSTPARSAPSSSRAAVQITGSAIPLAKAPSSPSNRSGGLIGLGAPVAHASSTPLSPGKSSLAPHVHAAAVHSSSNGQHQHASALKLPISTRKGAGAGASASPSSPVSLLRSPRQLHLSGSASSRSPPKGVSPTAASSRKKSARPTGPASSDHTPLHSARGNAVVVAEHSPTFLPPSSSSSSAAAAAAVAAPSQIPCLRGVPPSDASPVRAGHSRAEQPFDLGWAVEYIRSALLRARVPARISPRRVDTEQSAVVFAPWSGPLGPLKLAEFDVTEFVDTLRARYTQIAAVPRDGVSEQCHPSLCIPGIVTRKQLNLFFWRMQGHDGELSAPEDLPPELRETVDTMLDGMGGKEFFTFWEFANMQLADQPFQIAPPSTTFVLQLPASPRSRGSPKATASQASKPRFSIDAAMSQVALQLRLAIAADTGAAARLCDPSDFLSRLRLQWALIDGQGDGSVSYAQLKTFVWETCRATEEREPGTSAPRSDSEPEKLPSEMQEQLELLLLGSADKQALTFWDFTNTLLAAEGVTATIVLENN